MSTTSEARSRVRDAKLAKIQAERTERRAIGQALQQIESNDVGDAIRTMLKRLYDSHVAELVRTSSKRRDIHKLLGVIAGIDLVGHEMAACIKIARVEAAKDEAEAKRKGEGAALDTEALLRSHMARTGGAGGLPR